MSEAGLACSREQRRHDVRRARLNGLDYLEVGEDGRTLTVTFLGKAPDSLTPANVRISGGRRVRDVRAVDVKICRQDDPELDDSVEILVDRPGDLSTYTLCIVEVERGRPTARLHRAFDPRYACLEFTFAAGCPSDLDCKVAPVCPPEPRVQPEIDYLAKDYDSFRQIILDRLSLLVPDWRETHVPDIGITLVELLAYVGDHLSYYQDSVATEAYLDTARRRVSVRRHARLVDYPMHDGCNARAWVHIAAGQDITLASDSFYLVTGLSHPVRPGHPLSAEDLLPVPPDQYEVFEPLAAGQISLYAAHNTISLYTWGDTECCLPAGATAATLFDDWQPGVPLLPPPGEKYRDDAPFTQASPAKIPDGRQESPPERALRLQAGDLILFEEVIGPETGDPADANPAHRHVVRLTRVTPGVDPLYNRPILEVEWATADALPFPLCISVIGPAPECRLLTDVSVARGNVILVDHGRTEEHDFDPVPAGEVIVACDEDGCPPTALTRPGTFRPVLRQAPLTFSQPLPAAGSPAARLLAQDARQALPSIWLAGVPADAAPGTDPRGPRRRWVPRRDLLGSGATDQHFVVEIEEDGSSRSGEGRAYLRFSRDGEMGRRPAAGTRFHATFRLGNGPAGNVGAGSISHLVLRNQRLSGVSLQPYNPLPARGGTAPEPLAQVKLLAPYAFRRELQRAVVAEDYAALVERDFADRVQRAAAELSWHGSWYTVVVAVDQRGRFEAEPALLEGVRAYLHRYRRIGHDVVVVAARQVPISLALEVCVLPAYLRGHVKRALLEALGSTVLPDGRTGFFSPDRLTFGQGIALSQIAAAAAAAPGVESVRVTRLERLGEGDNGELASGFLPLSALEVARLDNDPSFPENGSLTLDMRGGR